MTPTPGLAPGSQAMLDSGVMAAGLPFWDPTTVTITFVDQIPGTNMPLAIQPFGVLILLGVLVGTHLMRRWGAKNGLDDDHALGVVFWTAVVGFIGAHVFDVLFYQQDRLASDPMLLFRLWEGISSYGGFIGGVTGFALYARKHKLDFWQYGDGGIVAFIPAFTFGRLGCTVVHDHVGAKSDGFFLAVDYPAGFHSGVEGLHHNLGFYEFLYMVALCAVLFGLDRWRGRPKGLMVAVMATAYAPVRFFLEFLRDNPEADPRYLGLTFAQWVSIALLGAGIWLVTRLMRGDLEAESPPESAAGSGVSGKASGKSGKASGKASNKGKSGKGRKK